LHDRSTSVHDPPVVGSPRTFDDLVPGLAFEAGPRLLTRADIAAFATLSGDHTALHADDGYAATTPFGRIVAHGALNLAAATGLAYSTGIFEGTVLAVRSMQIQFDRPVYPDDLLSLRMVVQSRDERPRPDRGNVAFDVTLTNQDGRTVLSGTWSLVMRRAGGLSIRDL
jgi:oxepin-CoA hydrolase / 3-oxo-5,6-dehydrosuberyl-CoA semialdehyde dehydrogenase